MWWGPLQASLKRHLCLELSFLVSPGTSHLHSHLPSPAPPTLSPTLLRPRHLGKCPASSSYLGESLGCPEPPFFSSVEWDNVLPAPQRAALGADGPGPYTPAQCPEHRGALGTERPANPGIQAPCWAGKGGAGTQGDARGDPARTWVRVCQGGGPRGGGPGRWV